MLGLVSIGKRRNIDIDDHRIIHTWLAGPESKKQSFCEARMEKVVASILAMFSVCKLVTVVLMSF